jgi:hypothetical protein
MSVSRAQEILSAASNALVFDTLMFPPLSTAIPASISHKCDKSYDALVLQSARRLEYLIEQKVYHQVPEALDDLSGKIFFPAFQVDVVTATNRMRDCFSAMERRLDTEWPEFVQTSFLRLFTFSLALIGISEPSSVANFISDFFEYQVIYEQHRRVEFWLRALIVSPSEIVRQGRTNLQDALEMFVQVIATFVPPPQFDLIMRSFVIEIPDESDVLEDRWGTVTTRGPNPVREEKRNERLARDQRVIDQQGEHVQVFTINPIFFASSSGWLAPHQIPRREDYGLVSEQYTVYKNRHVRDRKAQKPGRR